MLKYYARRVLYIVVTFLIISVIMFGLYQLVPVDQVQLFTEGLQSTMSPAAFEMYKADVARMLGLDQPIIIQYFKWIGRMFTGDFGRSFIYRQPVIEVVKAPMANTILLNAITTILVFIIVIPLGIATAVKKGSVFDSTAQVVTMLGLSLPVFVTALATLLLFSLVLRWFPMGGAQTAGFVGTPFEMAMDKAKYMVLPILVMTFTSLAGLTRYIRATMIDALRTDYVRTARAKGLTEKVVIYSHAFRNCLIPFVTILVGWITGLFSGSLMVERIFLWNGMGNLMVNSVTNYDFAVAMTLNMFYVLLALLGNLIIDIIYTFVDPRIRLS